jgi:tetratricopeptide (TPR) repeat protein/predicted Ser/Thr protein kinase
VVGETLGQYRLTKELGKGGFATVYRALQPTLNRDVAVKVLHPEFIRDERALRRFKREALAVARLAHPNIVAVYDYGEHDGRAYLVMEYVAGKNLKNRLGRPTALSLALEVVTAVGSALDYAHSKGLVHRDVKPGNILFTEDNRIVLSDFGIVRLADDQSSLTRGVIGTPQYMAPEQALGREVDGRSDLYSLGIVLFEMLTGRVPFKGDTPVATLSMHATLPPPSARERNPELSEVIDAVVARTLAKAPEDRFQSGQELRTALAEAIAASQHPTESTVLVTSTAVTPTPVAMGAPDLEAAYRQLLDLVRRRDWRLAVNVAAQILAVDANYRDVSAILASASNELRFGRAATPAELDAVGPAAQADAAMNAGRLMEAATILHQALRANPDDLQARTRLQEVNRRMADEESRRRQAARLDQLYALALSKVRAEDWHWAIHILDEIAALDPTYRDIEELLAQARSNLLVPGTQEETPARRVASLRDQAALAMQEERWAEAQHFWEEVLRLEPGLAGVRDQLSIAQHHASISALNGQAARLAAEGRWQEAIEKLEEIKALTTQA